MSTFPGARADREEADYVVLGAPLDVSTTFQPGARFGPDRVRKFARTFDDYDARTGRSFSELAVADGGNVRAWDDAADYLDYLEAAVSEVRLDGAVPLVVGGEHTVSVAAVRALDPDVFVCLDAHLDLRADYDGNELSHATTTRHALSVADRAVILGARTGSPAEYERAGEGDVTVVGPERVAQADPDELLDDVLAGPQEADADPQVYLSVDVDAADPGFAPGTGTMEPFGLHPREMRGIVRRVAPAAAGFDVVEVNDRDDGQAAALAGKLLREFVYAHADGRHDSA